jgi:CBS domain containing-hemolysin-like protein
LPTDESDTLSGLVYTMVGRVPEVGDSVVVADTRLTVLTVDGRRIGRVKIQCLQDSVESKESKNVEEQHSSGLSSDSRKTVSGSP